MHHFGQKDIPFLTVVNSHNVDYPEQVVDYFNSLGSSKGMFLPTLKIGAAETTWEQTGISNDQYFGFMKRMLQHSNYGKKFHCLMIKRMLDNVINPTRDFRCMRSSCGAGQDYIVVDSRGDIFPCSHHVHREELKMGNINGPTPLARYFSKNRLLNELYETRRVENISECSRCPWRHMCEGGCSLDSYYYHGHMRGPSTLCGYYRKMYPFLLQCSIQHQDIITAYLEDEVEIISF
jgi:radical SAM protein with 4Fe4S-binding SPASM domain